MFALKRALPDSNQMFNIQQGIENYKNKTKGVRINSPHAEGNLIKLKELK